MSQIVGGAMFLLLAGGTVAYSLISGQVPRWPVINRSRRPSEFWLHVGFFSLFAIFGVYLIATGLGL